MLGKLLALSPHTYVTLPMLGLSHFDIPGYLDLFEVEEEYPDYPLHALILVHKDFADSAAKLLPTAVKRESAQQNTEPQEVWSHYEQFLVPIPPEWCAPYSKLVNSDWRFYTQHPEVLEQACKLYPQYAPLMRQWWKAAITLCKQLA